MERTHLVAVYMLVLILVTGCAGTTTVILMPDENGKVGAVTVTTKHDFRSIDKAYSSVSTTKHSANLTQIQPLDESNVTVDYATVLKAQPSKAVSFVLYFLVGSTKLTDESLAMIPKMIATIKERSPTEISIIGHTDTIGEEERNLQLSLDRAKAMQKIIKENMAGKNPISIKWFGSHAPLIATPPNVNEPKNRRVEIFIL